VPVKTKEKMRLERSFAAEVAKIFEWSHPRIETSEVLYRKAAQLRDILAREDFKGCELANSIARLNIDQLKALAKHGMNIWERERTRARGFDLDPLHLLKEAIKAAAQEETDKAVFESIVREVI